MATVAEVIDHLEDALNAAQELQEERDGVEGLPAVLDAISQIRRGAYDDAITTLEREFLPKFASSVEAQAALLRHMVGTLQTKRAA